MLFMWQGSGGNGGLFYHDKASGPVALTIDDPLRPGANIGAGSFNMHRVQVHVTVEDLMWSWGDHVSRCSMTIARVKVRVHHADAVVHQSGIALMLQSGA